MRTIGFPKKRLDLPQPVVVTVGMYDGVHLGHQAILQRVTSQAGTSVCVTFSNHPSSVTRPDRPACLLCSPEYKQVLMERCGLDLLSLFPFTEAFSEQEAPDFLAHLKTHLGMTRLVLGHDARLGRGRRGTPEVVQACGVELGFAVEYLKALQVGGHSISSSRIRQAICEGNLSRAKSLLGRPLGYFGPVQRGAGKGEVLAARTANLDVADLCIPPFGVYAVTASFDDQILPGVANLGVAPTLHADRKTALEVHLFDFEGDLYGWEIEVALHAFIRPERHFKTVEALRDQIQSDASQARNLLKAVSVS